MFLNLASAPISPVASAKEPLHHNGFYPLDAHLNGNLLHQGSMVLYNRTWTDRLKLVGGASEGHSKMRWNAAFAAGIVLCKFMIVISDCNCSHFGSHRFRIACLRYCCDVGYEIIPCWCSVRRGSDMVWSDRATELLDEATAPNLQGGDAETGCVLGH